MSLDRRSFVRALIAAPAIVRIGALMALPRAPWPPLIRMGDLLVCNGALVRVQDYPELFDVIGQTYGGIPDVCFRLPDLNPSPVADMALGWTPTGYAINANPSSRGPIGMLSLYAGLPA